MIQKVLFFGLLLSFFSCSNTGNTSADTATKEEEMEKQNVAAAPPVISRLIKDTIVYKNGERQLIKNFNDPYTIVFFLVRHCEKAKDGTNNPPLTEEGEARAVRLGKVLDGCPITRIATTNLKRTIATGEALVPYVMAAPLETFPPQATPDWLEEVLNSNVGDKFVVVGHQNTIPEILNQLTATAEYSLIPADEFGNLWIVSYGGPGKVEVTHCWYE